APTLWTFYRHPLPLLFPSTSRARPPQVRLLPTGFPATACHGDGEGGPSTAPNAVRTTRCFPPRRRAPRERERTTGSRRATSPRTHAARPECPRHATSEGYGLSPSAANPW